MEEMINKNEAFAFSEWILKFEHGSTDIKGNKEYRPKGGGVFSKCYTIEELYNNFKKEQKFYNNNKL